MEPKQRVDIQVIRTRMPFGTGSPFKPAISSVFVFRIAKGSVSEMQTSQRCLVAGVSPLCLSLQKSKSRKTRPAWSTYQSAAAIIQTLSASLRT